MPQSCRARAVAMVVIMAFAATLVGCGPSDATSLKPEERNPHYIKGRKYKEKRDFQAAADSFKKAVRVNPDFAQAHLELALIYDDKLSDQVSAIYHYKRYLELEPNSNMSSLVRDYIDRARLTLSVRPASSTMATVQDMSQLPRETTTVLPPVTPQPSPQTLTPVPQPQPQPQPHQQAVVAPTPVPAPVPQPKPQPVAQPQPSPTPPTRAAIKPPPPPKPKPTPTPQRVTTVTNHQPKVHVSQPAPAPKPPPPKATPTVETPAGRTHIVRQGDTLESLALQYYGTRAQWEKIYKANTDALPSKRDLQVGQRLTIP